MPDAEPAQFIIEPFDPERHDRTALSCGIEQADSYFRKTANKLTKADNVRLFVMLAPDGALIGFHAVNAHSVNYTELPPKFTRTRPSHGNISVAYISMIGRDERFKGSGYGSDLLVDALRRIAVAAESLGIALVMLDVLDCGDPARVARRKALYAGFGFLPLPSHDLRMFLPVATVRALVDEADRTAVMASPPNE